mmetsp:Transcript_10558/g.22830  ORF Transcript_10558/g.22830 Transcript_10558/m.22830 type:complete len:210 (-) Transcript_10558:285-914(-)
MPDQFQEIFVGVLLVRPDELGGHRGEGPLDALGAGGFLVPDLIEQIQRSMEQLTLLPHPLHTPHSLCKKLQPKHRLGDRGKIARVPNVPDALRGPVHRGGTGHLVRRVGRAGLALEPAPGRLGDGNLGCHQGFHDAGGGLGPQHGPDAGSLLSLNLRRRQRTPHSWAYPRLPPHRHRRHRRRRWRRHRHLRLHPGGGGGPRVLGGELGS